MASDPEAPVVGLATPVGRSALAVIRLTGAGVLQRVLPFLRHPGQVRPLYEGEICHRTARLCDFHDGTDGTDNSPVDQLLLLFFPAARSFTGEDQVELQCHGSPVIVERIIGALVASGIRPAQPGEFSRRAFSHGKLDLLQVEALASLVDATSVRAVRQAARQLNGALSRRFATIKATLVEAALQIEAHIDFSDEEITPADEQAILEQVRMAQGEVDALLRGATFGRPLRHGFELVVVGRPNVGKSSLFNALVGRDKAIVTAMPGTTRDLIEHELHVAGLSLLLTDTAGLRTSDDLVEQAGIGRARERMEQADGCLFVVDATAGWLPEDQAIADTLPLERTLLVINKSDGLVDPAMAGAAYADRLPGSPHVVVSCHTGAGLDRLLEVVTGQLARIPDEGEGTIIMAARQQDVVQRLALDLAEAVALLQRDSAGMGTLELAALPLRSALDAIGELTGTVTREDVLARIFSQFCIGK